MQDKRTEVTEGTILEFFRRAIEVIDGVSSHFVFNMDEMAHQDWEDQGSRLVWFLQHIMTIMSICRSHVPAKGSP
jgi:hypothetical protein